jgi:glycosyltransferase involved in cell wall biosynthesis
MSVAFLFTNPRDWIISGIKTGSEPDTALRGMNHIEGADYFTVYPKSFKSLLFIPRLLRCDFIIAQDNFMLGYIVSVFARAFGLKTRWIYTAIHSSTLMRRHANHPLRLFIFKKFWNSYFRIICLSHEQLEDLARLGVSRRKLVFVPFGVDAGFYRPIDALPHEDLIVSVGRDAGRDYETLFKTAELTNHKFIVVAGHKNIPTGMAIPKNVSVLYDRSPIEIRELYARARLVIIASKDESQPDGSDCSGQTVILDALAAGKAVIATRRSWIADYFVHDEDLVVVPPNDPESLAQAIVALSRDPEKRKRIAESGHAKVIKNYNTKNFAEALQRIMH